MSGVVSTNATPSAYVCKLPENEVQNQLSTAAAFAGAGSSSASDSNCFYLDFYSYTPMFDYQSSSNVIWINDLLISQRRLLYDLLSHSSFDDDSQALEFFEEMRSTYNDSQCFGQIMRIFLGAYKKKDDSMIVRTLRFMLNFSYNEIGQVGISAARMSLLDSRSLDVQSAALSLVLRWKSDEFRGILSDYHAPKDPFINIKMKKISAWYTSAK